MLIRVMILVFMLTLVSVSSGDINIRAILVGDKVLELADTRQLTFKEDGNVTLATISPNGRHVVYITERGTQNQMCVIRTSGDSPKVVLETEYGEGAPEGGRWFINNTSPPIWSPDSKLFALPIRRESEMAPGEIGYEKWLLVFVWNGTRYAGFKIPDDLELVGDQLSWSPDSRNLAIIATTTPREPDQGRNSDVVIFNLTDGSMHTIYSYSGWLWIDRWTDRGDGLSCYSSGQDGKHVITVYLDGREPLISNIPESGLTFSKLASLDRVFRLSLDYSQLQIETVTTGEVVQTIDVPQQDFLGWLPNSRIFAYNRKQSIKDGPDGREDHINSIWLSTLTPGKHNRMCLALDNDHVHQLNWSSDSLKTTFIRNGRLYLAELAWRPATLREKVEAGLPLTEDEERNLLRNNAKEIGVALMLYSGDWEGGLPVSEVDIESQLTPYLKDKNRLYRPGTQNMVFRYIPQANGGDIENPVKTIIGVIDVGYSWQVNLFADGHVTTTEKQQ